MSKTRDKESWLTIRLTPELSERINKYILAVANKKGSIPYALRTKIALEALNEWLNKYENDLDHF